MRMEQAFEQKAQDLLHRTEQYLHCTEIAKAHTEATPVSLGADLDIYLRAAANLEAAARNLRQMCTSGHAIRHQAETAQPIPVLTVGC